MRSEDFEQLTSDIKIALAGDDQMTFGLLGHTPLTYDLLAFFRAIGADNRLSGVYTEKPVSEQLSQFHSLQDLSADCPTCIVVASDEEKERLLEAAANLLPPETHVLFGGYRQFEFRDPVFNQITQSALVPSLANGYPNTLVHLYQCLQNAARLGLKGVIAEFGMFKGGTTMLLSRFAEALGGDWKVIGFDTFAGFPRKKNVLDMYAHPDCIFLDENLVRRFVSGRNIEVVSGDVCETAQRLTAEDVVLVFMDTDNYSSASAVLDVVQERIVVGGAIVFDHFAGRNRFRYTLGERIAAKRLLRDERFFNLHDTGVFLRQR